MEHFAGLDVSMAETHVCVMNRDSAVVYEVKVPSTPSDIAAAFAKAPACERIVFETGRMAPMLYHGLSQLGLPVVCVESRQAYHALKFVSDTQRCTRPGASCPHRLLQARPCEVPAGTRCPLPDHRPQEAGRPAGHSGEPDPRSCRRVRCPTAACAQPSLHQTGAPGERGYCWPVCRHAGSIAARTAVLGAVVAIDADIKGMVRASDACRRLMSIPGVGQLTALAFTAAVDDPSRFRRSRDIGPYLGLVPRRYQSGEVDYTGSISKCGDRRMRTLLYEAANVMLTRYKGPLRLKDWAFAVAKRSTMRKARIALARRLAIIMHAMLRHSTQFKPA